MAYFPPKSIFDSVGSPGANEYLRGDADGSVKWDVPPFKDFFVRNTEFSNVRMFAQASMSFRDGTQTGYVTFYPTTTGDSTGQALFSSIIFAMAAPIKNKTAANNTHFCAGRTISADLKAVSFNVTKGSVAVLGGTGLTSGDANTPCTCIIIGIPA